MGIINNAGNERKYYKQYKAETSDNIMESNSYKNYNNNSRNNRRSKSTCYSATNKNSANSN